MQRTLAACDRTSIPVYSGASCALVQQPFDASYFHGQDGLGDVSKEGEHLDRIQPLRSKHAVNALIDHCFEGMKIVERGHTEGLLARRDAWRSSLTLLQTQYRTALDAAKVRDAELLGEDVCCYLS